MIAPPHVTGALALLAAAHPGTADSALGAGLLGSVEPTDSLDGVTVTGGRIDIGDLMLLG